MGKCLLAVFALSFLALFAFPVYAMEPNMPLTNEIISPIPNETLGAYPTSIGPQTKNNIPPGTGSAAVSREQAIRNRIINAVQERNQAPANATAIKNQIAQRIGQVTTVRPQDMRQTENFILQARQVIGTLNATQKRQLANVVYGFVNSSMDNRVQVAARFETRGLDPARVEAYNATVEALKAQIAAANSTQERRRLVVQANYEWAVFKRDVVKQAAWARIRNVTDKAQAALDNIDALVTRLAQNGTDTTKLVNISARVQNRIDAARQENITLRQSEWRLAYARDGLAYLANQVRRAVRAQAIDDMQEQTEPVELAVEDQVDAGTTQAAAEPTPAAVETPTATPTTMANATESQ